MTIAITTTATWRGNWRFWFGLDAAITGANAIAYAGIAGTLADHLGGSVPTYRAVGLGLFVFSIVVAAYATSSDASTATRRALRRGSAIVVVNIAWVVASIAVAVADVGGFETAGRLWIAAQAAVVAGLATMQRSTL